MKPTQHNCFHEINEKTTKAKYNTRMPYAMGFDEPSIKTSLNIMEELC